MKSEGVLIVVSGFSGAGKGTLMKKLVSEYTDYALSVSATTRAPREGEENGREYFFMDKAAFEERIASNGLIEYTCYCDNYYGTPRDYVERQMAEGKDVILEIEIQGALNIKKQYPTALLLFVMPPSITELEHRLTMRGTESPEVVKKRLLRAVEEAKSIEEYDYIVVNDDLDTCVKQLHEIITAAHNKPSRNGAFIEQIRNELEDLVKGEK